MIEPSPHRGSGVFDLAFDAFVHELLRIDESHAWPSSIPQHGGRPRLRVARAILGPHHLEWLDPSEVARVLADRIGRTGRFRVEQLDASLALDREPPAEVSVEVATPYWAPGQIRAWTVLIVLRGDGGHVVAMTLTRFQSLEPN